jgi:hypothetical protein
MQCHRCGMSKQRQGPCGHCGARVHNLSDMDFDEISFVPRGANQEAHVVLWKSEDALARSQSDGEPDPQDVTEGYAIVKSEETRQEILHKRLGMLVLAERAEARLSELRKADPLATYEQAVSVVLDEDPGLYQP